MTDKWALVTGSSHGLGLEIALKLAESGFRIVITGRNKESLMLAMNKLKSISKQMNMSVCLDLTDEAAPAKLHAKLKELDISLSIIINNLGGSITGDTRNVPLDILRAAMRLNLEVGVEINNLFYKDLKTNHGVIVHIGSTASLHFDAPPGYVISKSAINAYVKNAARAFAKDDVCIFAVLPGILEHEGSYISCLNTSNPRQYKKALSESVFGRFATSKELAHFISSLIDAHTPMLNGSLIQFDGGKE
jgi:NAD(P)-dependent dehydrogenase (short-subunit alcohol dehydrogenase family)